VAAAYPEKKEKQAARNFDPMAVRLSICAPLALCPDYIKTNSGGKVAGVLGTWLDK
jgi:hypothetical protein